MSKIFENQTNGHREEIGDLAGVAACLFGLFYFAVKGLWRHVVIQIALIIFFLAAFGAPGIMFIVVMWIVYGFFASSILRARYLRDGWKEVSENLSPGTASWPPVIKAASERACPFCAEPIKLAAIRCRHCHADVPAVAAVVAQASMGQAFMPKSTTEKPLAQGDMKCFNCKKHVPIDASSCAFCGQRFAPATS